MSLEFKILSKLGLGQIHLWSINAVENIDLLDSLLNNLSYDEVSRANKFRFEKDRSVYITAKYLLRTLLGQYLNVDPKKIVFEYSEFDRPSYLNNIALDFNVSHSGNQIIIGFAKNLTIGVDIEKIKNNFDPLELAENFFSKEEIEALSETNESEKFQAFYRCWTRKESFIKAVGEGLSYPLDSFAVTMNDNENAKFIKIDNTQEAKRNWRLYSFIPAKGYIAAITTDGTPNKIEYFDANEYLH